MPLPGAGERHVVQRGQARPFSRRAARAFVLLLIALAPARAPALIRVGGVSGLDARDVQVVGRLAYVADSSFGLRVIDASNPEGPAAIGGLAQPSALSVAVEGDLAVLSFGLPYLPVVIDVSDPEQPTELARFDHAWCNGRAILVDRIAYVAGTHLCVMDLTEPSRPRRLALLPLPGPVNDIERVGHVAFLATQFGIFLSGSLELVDLSTPAEPVMLPRVQFPSIAYDVAVAGDVAWVAHGDALTAIDVSDPHAAAAIATTPIASVVPGPRHMEIRGSTGYLTARERGVQAFDLSDPLAPRPLGSLKTPGLAYGITLVGQLAFVATAFTGGALELIDVSYPFAPVELSHHETPASALAVALQGDRAYLAGSQAWSGPGFLEILDVSDPAAPAPLGALGLSAAVRDVELVGETACLAGGEFRTIDVADPTDPAPLAELDSYAEELEVVGSLAVTDQRRFDVSDPSAPVDVGGGGQSNAFVILDDLVYRTEHSGGMVVTELATAAVVATLPSSLPGSRFAASIDVEGATAYLGEQGAVGNEEPGFGWLRAIDVSDPGLPEELATLETHGAVHDVEAAAGLVYLAAQGYDASGVAAIDVADPTRPRALGAFPTPGLPEDVEVENGLVHLADGPGGFRILDFGPEYGGARAPVPLLVDVDVGPGSRDRIKPRRRRFKVALLASPSLSPAEIDPASLAFGPSGVPATGRVRLRDVNRDGVRDLVARFALGDGGLGSGRVDACVEGSLRDGRRFVGCDDVFVRAR